jgi:hypothetical protein
MTALEVVEAYLAARRALGVLLDRQGRFLRQFVRETGNAAVRRHAYCGRQFLARPRNADCDLAGEESVAGGSIPVRDQPRLRCGIAVAGASAQTVPATDALRVLERGVAASTRCDCSAQPSSQSPPVNDLSDVALAALRLRVTSGRGDRT